MNIKAFILVALSGTIVVQGTVNIYLYQLFLNQTLPDYTDDIRTSDNYKNKPISEHLISIDNKLAELVVALDTLKQQPNIIDNIALQQTQEESTEPEETLFTNDTKYQLINDLHEYDMTLSSLLSDPKLKKLTKEDRNEVFKEMIRKINTGEIDKNTFLPGYNN